MKRESLALFTGITHRRWTGIILIWLAVSLPLALLYLTSRHVVMNEIRSHAMSVAIAAAAGIDPLLLDKIEGPADVDTLPFRQVQAYLDRISTSTPDIRYIYTMRRSRVPFAPATHYEYIVDQSARDFNGNGRIDREEQSELPGTPYRADTLPEMVAAWERPGADLTITPDPPYPDLLSGYAPIKNANGETRAIVGVDITAQTVNRKLFVIRVVVVLVWLVISVLLLLVIQLYYQQRDAFEQNKELSDELAVRNEMLRAANVELSLHGTTPASAPVSRMVFDTYYLKCAAHGGHLLDVFDVDQDHVAFYIADVADRSISAALVTGLLKVAVAAARGDGEKSEGLVYADLTQPNMVLQTLNRMLTKEKPSDEAVTMTYAVLNIPDGTMTMATAGHPAPIHYMAARQNHELWRLAGGASLGLLEDQEFAPLTTKVEEKDKVVFYTEGLIMAANASGELFGETRLRQLINEHGDKSPIEIVEHIHRAVEAHRDRRLQTRDYTLLVVEIR